MTGEDVLEFHVHGGNAITKSVLAAIPLSVSEDSSRNTSKIIRYAEPGEFTRRAFYNNRLDLIQIEALGDSLSAETEQQRRIAVKGSSGMLSECYESWRQQLLLARGELEALIDFSEDQQFETTPTQQVKSVVSQVEQLLHQVQDSIQNASRGELLRNGISIALLGAPNAGKSSLLNRIVGREAAIVSTEEGTTRDIIDVGVDLGGFYCKFGDLAGLRNGSEKNVLPVTEIEKEGIKRAKERALAADVVIVVLSFESDPERPEYGVHHIPINGEVARTLKHLDLKKQKVVYVVNKSDRLDSLEKANILPSKARDHLTSFDLPPSDIPITAISCGEAPGGIEELLSSLISLFERMTSTSGYDSTSWEHSLGTSQRQKQLLEDCLQSLKLFLAQVGGNQDERDETSLDVVLAAESLRSAADCLARIMGRIESGSVEEVLGVVFEK